MFSRGPPYIFIIYIYIFCSRYIHSTKKFKLVRLLCTHILLIHVRVMKSAPQCFSVNDVTNIQRDSHFLKSTSYVRYAHAK